MYRNYKEFIKEKGKNKYNLGDVLVDDNDVQFTIIGIVLNQNIIDKDTDYIYTLSRFDGTNYFLTVEQNEIDLFFKKKD